MSNAIIPNLFSAFFLSLINLAVAMFVQEDEHQKRIYIAINTITNELKATISNKSLHSSSVAGNASYVVVIRLQTVAIKVGLSTKTLSG